MQGRDDAALKVVVVDYHNCAFSQLNGNDEHFLSPKLITFLKTNHYDAFVGHTFRCIINTKELLDKILEGVPPSQAKTFRDNFPIAAITGHLATRTEVACLNVATLDDLVTDQVGQGYDDLVSYEESGVINQNKHAQPDQQYSLMQLNNKLLLLIAQNIAAKYAGKEVQLDIIDDDFQHCQQARSADRLDNWPANVKLNNIYRFSVKILDNEVRLISGPGNSASAAIAPAPRRQQKQHAVPNHRPLDRDQADAYAASVLVTGTFGTFSRPTASSSAAAAANPDNLRRSERLAGKTRVTY